MALVIAELIAASLLGACASSIAFACHLLPERRSVGTANEVPSVTWSYGQPIYYGVDSINSTCQPSVTWSFWGIE